MTNSKLSEEKKKKIILKNPRVQLLLECIKTGIDDTINELIQDIMSSKSLSYGEAYIIVINCLKRGIFPKSKEFYQIMDKMKTPWEM